MARKPPQARRLKSQINIISNKASLRLEGGTDVPVCADNRREFAQTRMSVPRYCSGFSMARIARIDVELPPILKSRHPKDQTRVERPSTHLGTTSKSARG